MITAFKDNHWKPALILCTDEEAVERLKSYDDMDHLLFNYYCGIDKIFVSEINIEKISQIVFDRLEQIDYELTDDFKTGFDNYIEAVYPEAVLKKEEFFDDLIDRINREHNSVIHIFTEVE